MSTISEKAISRHQISVATCVWMIVVAFIIACGGVDYALVKNDITAIRIEQDKLERLTANAQMSASMYHARANELTHRWTILDRLSQTGSELQAISIDQIETPHSQEDSALSQHDARMLPRTAPYLVTP